MSLVKNFRDAALVILGFIAGGIIVTILKSSTVTFLNAIFVLISLIYLHWLIHRSLLSLHLLPEPLRQYVKNKTKLNYYNSVFLCRAIILGYIFAIVAFFAWVPPDQIDLQRYKDSVVLALILIGMGILFYIRSVVITLVVELSNAPIASFNPDADNPSEDFSEKGDGPFFPVHD